ncbi:hypothetical protein [Agrobacterium rosae]|uniref:Uncharacterized protein n=1 Tax=Agrobacterium rosae TaxID=1972867 RepID=A0A1R3TV21_9HYPH|nr:hypothetical protein [Agrobacterium rosae]KAA3510891.1 hypothetical protein DXM21_15225 [Agrobacterium rosae]KAA3517928.1 hypothetical protein DXM25_15275 [Agrobacterium rosae]MBN7807644.1 hypothetical protein [Agrobacterium rosae]MCM2434199.1 hypothetical protein [Agrobacterium rosae]MDX8303785.1 hypothetical protein [Agrobacterium rosae]
MELRKDTHVTMSVFIQHRTFRNRLSGSSGSQRGVCSMNQIIYIVGLVVIVLAILSFFGFR